MNTLLQDVRFGLRMLAKNPGFTAVAVLTLALGIGGTTAIFSVIYCGLLDPFPYADTHRLAVLVSRDTRQGDYVPFAWVSAAEFLDYREQTQVFDEVIGAAGAEALLTGTDAPEFLNAIQVTDNFFRALGVPPLIGRPLTPEDAKPGAPPVVVLSHKAWQKKFGGDPGIVGRVLVLNRKLTTVVGVMPPRFSPYGAEIWVPAPLTRGNAASEPSLFSLIAHLKPGVTIQQAKAEVSFLAKRFVTLRPKDHPPEVTYSVLFFTEAAVADVSKRTLTILLGAVGFLLLIGCVNVANLLLARATAREKEIAVRAALGASRGRLVRQLLMESLLLAFSGAVVGCMLAWDGLGALVAIIPFGYIPSEAVIRINSSILLFTVGTALLSTLLFGLAPALLAASRDLREPLKAAGRGSGESRGHHRLRNLLVVGEVALSLVLLSGAGVLLRSFWALRHVELGYNLDNLLRAGAFLPEERYKTAEERNQFQLEIARRVRALPGVVSAALGWPSLNWANFAQFEITGQTSAESQSAWFRGAGDRYFETVGIPLLQGRPFSEEDLIHSRAVIVVNRAFVKKYLADKNPLGQQVKVIPPSWFPSLNEAEFEIVGVVADTRHNDGTGPTMQPQIYLPSTIMGVPWQQLFVRTAGKPATLATAVRQEFASIDKDLPAGAVPANDDLRDWYNEPRFVTTMLVAFALLGLVLVSVGVYSVLSYAVSRRTHEIGVRMALGAQATDVRRMVMMSGLRWLAIGIGIGVPASIALAKILQNRIWGIKSADPLTLVAVSVLLTLVGLAACYFPARRATKVDPLVALRYE